MDIAQIPANSQSPYGYSSNTNLRLHCQVLFSFTELAFHPLKLIPQLVRIDFNILLLEKCYHLFFGKYHRERPSIINWIISIDYVTVRWWLEKYSYKPSNLVPSNSLSGWASNFRTTKCRTTNISKIKIANITITKDELFDSFIFEFDFSYFRNPLNTQNI